MNASQNDPKLAKKLAKATAKAAKKQARAEQKVGPPAEGARAPAADRSPAERSAEAAERQVALQRWRVVLAVVGAIIALATLLVIVLSR